MRQTSATRHGTSPAVQETTLDSETAGLVRRYAAPVPRYTSYPTSPHFTGEVGPAEYAAWLGDVPRGARLSLYLHIPFCEQLCWYCACSTKAVRRYGPVSDHLQDLSAEIASVSRHLGASVEVVHIHWGGGSPNILTACDIGRLADTLRSSFPVREDAEFAAEIDPRTLTVDRVMAFVQAGLTRVSIGVQDFNPTVQKAIGREQSFAATERAIARFRDAGVCSINIDLVYGLPHQTCGTLEQTIGQVLRLRPDRVAAFAYAHLPERFRHQRLIDGAALPGIVHRFAQGQTVARLLREAGYLPVGLDHFALPGDPLARGPVRRNFQGYTTDAADVLIGLGASAIGRLAQGYVQNAGAVADYARRVREQGLATGRGLVLTPEDRARAFVIERLMCDLVFSGEELSRRHGVAADASLADAQALINSDTDGLIAPTQDGFRVTERGRPFLRAIAARFDAYLGRRNATHSLGV